MIDLDAAPIIFAEERPQKEFEKVFHDVVDHLNAIQDAFGGLKEKGPEFNTPQFGKFMENMIDMMVFAIEFLKDEWME